MPDTTNPTRTRIFHDLDFDKPGKQIGYLRVPQSRDGGAWSTVEIPIAVINGGKGPAVLFTGGVHGDEYEGQIAGSRLARRLDAQSLRGKVILMPAVDLPAALAGRRMCPIDGRDFNRCMPGNARGSFCEMLAHFIDTVIMPQVEVSVDVHAAGNSMEAALCTIMHWVDDPKIMARTQALTENFAAPGRCRCATSARICSRRPTDCSSRNFFPCRKCAPASWPAPCTSSRNGPANRCRLNFRSTATSGWRRVPAGCAKAT